MAKRETYNYNLKQGRKVVYKGTTNNLEKREQEHRNSGKRFDKIEKVGRVKTETGARKTEAKQLATYRKNHGGNNPKYNKTKNG
jgi:predicted GIY-YIG superfamily endonuclease